MIIRGAPGDRPGRGDRHGADRSANARQPAVRPARDAPRRGQRAEQRPADGGQPALGGRPGDGPLRGDRRPVRGRRRRSPTRCAPRPTRSSSRPPTTTAGSPSSVWRALPSRTTARADPDPLQHRAAGLRPVRDGARRRPGRAPRRPRRPRLGRRDAAVPPGRAADGLGAAQAGVPHTLIPDVAAGHLMARGEVDAVLVGRRPDRGQRRHGQQGRHVHAGRARGAPRHPVLRRAPRLSSVDLATPDGDAIPIEERAGRRGHSRSVACASRPPDTEVRNPAFDVTPAELITGDRHRGGRARARRSTASLRRGRRSARSAAAGDADDGPPAPRRAREPPRLMADGRDRPAARDDRRPPRPRTASCCATFLEQDRLLRRLRDLRPRGPRVRADALGRRATTATSRRASSSSTPG